jgi:hypothetical protein
MEAKPDVWTLTQAARLLGEPQHRLIYLCEKGVVVPDFQDAEGRGSRSNPLFVSVEGATSPGRSRAGPAAMTSSEQLVERSRARSGRFRKIEDEETAPALR